MKEGFNWTPKETKKFTDVSRQNSLNYKVNMGNRQINVYTYYREKYNYEIRFKYMPLLICGLGDRSVCYPIEVLQVSNRLERIRQKLPEYIQSMCTQFTVKEPKLRFKDTQRMVKEVEFGGGTQMDDPFLENFGIQLDHKLLQIDGRILPQPPVDVSQFTNAWEQPKIRIFNFSKKFRHDLRIVIKILKFFFCLLISPQFIGNPRSPTSRTDRKTSGFFPLCHRKFPPE